MREAKAAPMHRLHFMQVWAMLMMLLTGNAWAQSVAEPASIALALTAKQQTTLGVQVAPLQAASAGSVLVTASVVTPPGKEVAVSAPYAVQVSRWLVGVGDSVKAGAALAQFTSPMLGEARRQLNEAALESKNATAAAQRETWRSLPGSRGGR